MTLFRMQFSVNSIEKVKLQYIHLCNFLLNLYFMRGVAEHKIRRSSGRRSSAGFLKYIRYQEESGSLYGS